MRHLFLRLFVLLTLLAPAAQAHFVTGSESREIHVAPAEAGGTEVLLRFPLTFAFAHALATRPGPDGVVSAPFLRVNPGAGVPIYGVDMGAVAEDRAGFLAYLLKAYRFELGALQLDPVPGGMALLNNTDTGARDLKALRRGLQRGHVLNGDEHISEIDVLLRLHLPDVSARDALRVTITTPRVPLPPTMLFDTHVTDHRLFPPALFSLDGFVPAPITLEGSRLSAVQHWIWQGMAHIVFGFDHVLFVLCLVLAARGLRRLLWSVTGFTIGHSVTLTAGVLGLVPAAGWFIPAVELGVALSIVTMAALVLVRRSGPMGFGVAAALGLLHGFGFAFMLTPLLGEGALLLPLLGFNLGVELGQLGIVVLAFGAIALLDRRAARMARRLRYGTAAIAALIALTMSIERMALVAAELAPSASQQEGA